MDKRRISRRKFLKAGLAVGGGLIGASIAPKFIMAKELPPIVVAAPGSLVTEEIRNAFTKATGIKVSAGPWTNNAEVVSKMLAGKMAGVDLVSLWEVNLRLLMAQNVLAPIDISRIPNYSKLYSAFVKSPRVEMGGKYFGIPHMWGYDGVVYNMDKIKEIKSWELLFDEKYTGKTAIRDDPYMALTIAALVMGIPNPMQLSTADLNRCKTYFISKKKVFRTMWSNMAEAVNLLTAGEVWAMHGWMAFLPAAKKQGINAGYAIPKEGGLGFIHDYCMSRNTKATESCYAFLNWLLGSQYGLLLAKSNYPATSSACRDKLTPEQRKFLHHDDADEVVRSLNMLILPDNLPEYIRTWSEVKSA
jgi:spermidine/putrescine-binding protein